MTTFLDSCILIALLKEDDRLNEWSIEKLIECQKNGPAVICDIAYCEASVAMPSRVALDEAIHALGLERLRSSDDALFRAGRAYKKYRNERKGPKLGVLPDFLIGATAEVQGGPLLTDNRKDFVGYFPDVEMIAKE
jgi:predicted nucleic acid-binding protein